MNNNLQLITERLSIRPFTLNDAEFIVNLLNQPSFILNIADKQVRTVADAENYLRNGPLASYQQYGFGLCRVALKQSDTPIGMCGLLKRPELPYADIGYALLPEFCGHGYAFEAAQAVLKSTHGAHQLATILAITKPNNTSSNKLLMKLGFQAQGQLEIYGEQNNLYHYQAPAP
ncbi:MAG: Uncharacterised protein [Pseudidiomarina mangrovi]|nr:MAG: Uncharacterised protein [Pseudidiomarina mangrovi]